MSDGSGTSASNCAGSVSIGLSSVEYTTDSTHVLIWEPCQGWQNARGCIISWCELKVFTVG